MKKFKFILLTTAILLGISIAWATTPKAPCESETQYYYAGQGHYYPAGVEGDDYICERDWAFPVCTYTRISQVGIPGYAPCKQGRISFYK